MTDFGLSLAKNILNFNYTVFENYYKNQKNLIYFTQIYLSCLNSKILSVYKAYFSS